MTNNESTLRCGFRVQRKYKTYLPCEEIERGNRERCGDVKQDSKNTLENRKA